MAETQVQPACLTGLADPLDSSLAIVVIDGWGIPSDRSPKDGDAIAAAETPTMDAFSQDKEHFVELEASSNAVGLPKGLMGNSEVGHLNIGAGRVVWQDVVRIDANIDDGTFASNAVLKDMMEGAKSGNGRLHLCGLVSHGGVHAKQDHLYAILKAAKQYEVPKVFIHFFGDGRDTDPKSGAAYMEELIGQLQEIGIGEIATVVGRYYAMDRDKRWERIEIALKGMILGEGEESTDPVQTIKDRYAKGGSKDKDEFLTPIIVGGQESRIKDDDTVFFFNYRSDRVRQITQVLGNVDRSVLPDFPYPNIKPLVTMTRYKTDYPFTVAFEPQHMGNVLAEWIGKQKVKQVHVAETEKYAHVTFFFNGGVEKVFDLEVRDERDLVPSVKSVATYDEAPEMSAAGVAKRVADRIAGEDQVDKDTREKTEKYPFVMNNFAPPDMVGHTGNYEKAIIACKATDDGIKTIYEACKAHGYILFITSDHGNAEEMKFEDGKPKTSHTTNKVPFIMANAPNGWSLTDRVELKDGKVREPVLGDVAPTVLQAMGLPIPDEMTGQSLLVQPKSESDSKKRTHAESN
ncbi:Endoglucanase-6B [Verticillium dahliae VDG1]|nr:Pre-rRNA-processing protein esf1 [Verticillium dahliae VDG2]KAF3357650.1 Endoglucanase-6B [Verticillium dahliae VDG1]